MNFFRYPVILLTVFIFVSCSNYNNSQPNKELEVKMNSIAEQYVKLILKVGQHDPDYVDAYYGPEEWKPAEKITPGDSAVVQALYDEAGSLLDSLDSYSDQKADQLLTLRFRYLYKQLLAVRARIFMLAGGKFSFDEEAKALYDAEPPVYNEEHFNNILEELDRTLPGSGDISTRLAEFKKEFIIPEEKLDTVFQAAIQECRKRTLQHIKLPANENFVVSYVKDKPWGGYNWYKGNSFSVIEVNTSFPIYIDRAVDLAAHEGYPGHHVYNALLEKNMVKERGWVEFSVYPLFAPQSLIAEGTANYGIEVAFPGKTRIEFEKEVLFPLAGIDVSRADQYYKIDELTGKLSYAANEAARNYLNGDWTKEKAVNWLMKYSLMTPARAAGRMSFIDKYRSYNINYNLGKDIVKEYFERNGGTADNPGKRWEIMEYILSTPQTPSGLIK
ncbi:MAG: hypothetical protein R6W90_03290 [Ignavibacteriaceae bacterium]